MSVHKSVHTRTPRLRRAAAGLLAAGSLATGTVLVGGAMTGSADAAEVPTWERLANCESSQQWHINTGNGFYGGLQFTDSTWDAYKWPGAADRADHASKKSQILAAENVLDAQGWGAWPSCSDQLGLGPEDAKGKPYVN